MALSIYKPGQGFWTRILTAAGVAALVVTGVFWIWAELAVIGTGPATASKPRSELAQRLVSWGVANQHPIAALSAIRDVQTKIAPNESATFILLDNQNANYTISAQQLQTAWDFRLPSESAITRRIENTLPRPPHKLTLDGTTVLADLPPTFAYTNRLYIQLIVSVCILAFFTVLTWWLLNKPRIVDFMIATEAEMKKVNWPTRRETVGSTIVVVSGTFMMAVGLWVVDLIFSELFININILHAPSALRQLFLGS